MNPFAYTRAADVGDAIRTALAADERAGGPNGNGGAARYIAGGTNLIDLMKEHVEHPTHLIDITHLPLHTIDATSDGGLRIGALVTNSELAYDSRVQQRYPLLSRAILAGASAQLRNAASTGGNLLQRTRCFYFYDVATPCNKREPGTGCGAIGGATRMHAILGASAHCIATHPSDMCVALAALDATVRVSGPQGDRVIPFQDFHRLPGDRPDLDTTLQPHELITAVDLPPEGFATHFSYLKLRDRLSYAFALVSVAAALRLEGSTIREARLALGGVAHKPWRDRETERLLQGSPVARDLFSGAAAHLLRGARAEGDNAFKIELARRAIVRALEQAAAGTPQSITDKRIL